MTRRNFPRKVILAVVKRATDDSNQVHCEGCGLPVWSWEIDHVLADALSGKPTIENARLLGVKCCHKPKTADDVRRIRKADRQRNAHTGAKPKRQGFKGWRKFNGEAVWRD